MEFKKYQHIEKFGTPETEGIDIGEVWIFPKIDGSNCQLWWDEGLRAGSRNRELSLEKDNHGFYEWALKQEQFVKFFKDHLDLRLFGEWLKPHALKTYRHDAWDNFYVFDVMKDNIYFHYDAYKTMMEYYGIKYIPPICSVRNPTYERVQYQLQNNVFLIEEGKGIGEGIVVKNYNYTNKYGRITWAKMVTNEFKEKHWRNDTTEVKERKLVEEEIVNDFVTEHLIEKEYAKIASDDGWNSKMIPRLLNTVFYCLVKEESWSYVKKFKNPTIDYKRLYQFTINKVKQVKSELF